MSLNTTSACTVQYYWGMQGKDGEEVLADTLSLILREKRGYQSQGLAQVIYMCVKGETSGKRGHHNYTERGDDMDSFIAAVERNKLGTIMSSPYNGAETGTGSEIRIIAFGPIGPLEELMKAVEASDIYDKFRKCLDAAKTRATW